MTEVHFTDRELDIMSVLWRLGSGTVAAEAAGDSALGRIVSRIFDGFWELLLARLVANRRLSPDELARMRRLLEEAEAAQSGDEP